MLRYLGRAEDGYISYGQFRNFLLLLPPEQARPPTVEPACVAAFACGDTGPCSTARLPGAEAVPGIGSTLTLSGFSCQVRGTDPSVIWFEAASAVQLRAPQVAAGATGLVLLKAALAGALARHVRSLRCCSSLAGSSLVGMREECTAGSQSEACAFGAAGPRRRRCIRWIRSRLASRPAWARRRA